MSGIEMMHRAFARRKQLTEEGNAAKRIQEERMQPVTQALAELAGKLFLLDEQGMRTTRIYNGETYLWIPRSSSAYIHADAIIRLEIEYAPAKERYFVSVMYASRRVESHPFSATDWQQAVDSFLYVLSGCAVWYEDIS